MARRVEDAEVELTAQVDAGRAQVVMGSAEAARHHAEAALMLGERMGDRYRMSIAIRLNATLARMEGRWSDALELCRRGQVLAPRDTPILGERVLLAHELGNFADGETYLDQMLETMHRAFVRPGVEYAYPSLVIPGVARITGVANRLDEAEKTATFVLSSPVAKNDLHAWPLIKTLAAGGPPW